MFGCATKETAAKARQPTLSAACAVSGRGRIITTGGVERGEPAEEEVEGGGGDDVVEEARVAAETRGAMETRGGEERMREDERERRRDVSGEEGKQTVGGEVTRMAAREEVRREPGARRPRWLIHATVPCVVKRAGSEGRGQIARGGAGRVGATRTAASGPRSGKTRRDLLERARRDEGVRTRRTQTTYPAAESTITACAADAARLTTVVRVARMSVESWGVGVHLPFSCFSAATRKTSAAFPR